MEEAVLESETSQTTISGLKKEIENFHDNNDKIIKSSVEEKRNLQIKHEKICTVNRALKNEKENLQKELVQSSVALKSSKKEIKDQTHQHQKKIEAFEDKLKDLLEYKSHKASEEKELKTKLKKVEKKLKVLREKEAEIKVEKSNLERDKSHKNDKVSKDNNNPSHVETNAENKIPETSSILCTHFPQCSIRQPKPPPIEPPTFKQFELNEAISKTETLESEIENFVENVVNFLKEEGPNDDLDITITKLEALKKMLDPEAETEGRTSQFDELIELAKTSRDIIENRKNEKEEGFDDDDYLDYESDDLPRHYYGEDGELIFEDD